MKIEEYKFKNDDHPFEVLMCPYCGYRLNRVKGHIPTYCEECNHNKMIPKILMVKEVVKTVKK